MTNPSARGHRSRWLPVATLAVIVVATAAAGSRGDDRIDRTVSRGLDWLAAKQSRRGSWTANENRYPTAMTALAGTAMLMEGSTTTQGRHAEPIRRAVDYLVSRARRRGPGRGHGAAPSPP